MKRRVAVCFAFFIIIILSINPCFGFAERIDVTGPNIEQRVNDLESEIIRLKATQENYKYLKEETKEYRDYIEKEREQYQSYIENLINKAYWFFGIIIGLLSFIFAFLGIKTWVDIRKSFYEMIKRLELEAEAKLRKTLNENLTRFVDERLELKIEPIKESFEELQRLKRGPFMEVDGLPTKKNIPAGIIRFFCMPITNEEDETNLNLFGEDKDGYLHFYGCLGFKGWFNLFKSGIYFNEDKLYLYSQAPCSMHTYHAEYLWDGDKANLVKEWEDDPAKEALEAAKNRLNSGDVSGAITCLENMMYPSFYYNEYEMTATIIETAHRFALNEYMRGRTNEAVKVLNDAFNTLSDASIGNIIEELVQIDSVEDYGKSQFVDYLSLNKYLDILNDYSYLLGKNGEGQKSTEILAKLKKMDPSITAIHEPE